MGVDVDPNTLAAASAASAHAYQQARLHIDEEIKARDPNNLSALIASLAPEGPYAYTIMPRVRPDGGVELPILTTREEIAEAYHFVRGMSDLHEVVGLTEVRGAWYLFQDAMTVGGPSGSDIRNHRQTLGLFPSGTERGITGELVWLRVPRIQLGGPDDPEVIAEDELHGRRMVYDRFVQYVDALTANDLDRILEPIHDGVASAVRDYVSGAGGLVELAGKDAHQAWFGRFLAKYEVRSVQTLHLVVTDWYVFAELRIVVASQDDDRSRAFHVAEYYMPAKDGRFIARIGHGTEPV